MTNDKQPMEGTPLAKSLRAFCFRDYGKTAGEIVRTLRDIATAIGNCEEMRDNGFSGDEVCGIAVIVNSLINRVYGVHDELTEDELLGKTADEMLSRGLWKD